MVHHLNLSTNNTKFLRTQHHSQWVPGLKRPGCEVYHSRSSCAETNEWSHTCTPLYALMEQPGTTLVIYHFFHHYFILILYLSLRKWPNKCLIHLQHWKKKRYKNWQPCIGDTPTSEFRTTLTLVSLWTIWIMKVNEWPPLAWWCNRSTNTYHVDLYWNWVTTGILASAFR
jgi:hypothetical protein